MKRMMTRACALALAALAACSGGSDDAPPPPTPTVTVTPANPTIAAGGGTVQLTATLANVTGTVVWSIETAGADVGTVSQAGLYTPPASLAAGKDVVVKAAVGTVSGTATVHVTAAVEGVTLAITTARPLAAVTAGSGESRPIQVATNTATANVTWTRSPALGSLSETLGTDTSYEAPTVFVSAATTVTITAQVTSLGLSDSITVLVNPTPLVLTGPTTVKVAGATAQYSVATDVGEETVAWSLVPADGSVGTISASGLYTPPSTLSGAARTFQVVATVGEATGSLDVTLQPVTISIAPASGTMASGGTRVFTATVDPAAAASQLAWTVVSGGGTIDASGNPATYTAPSVEVDTVVTVRATAAGAAQTATVTVLAAAPTFTVSGIVVDDDDVTPLAGAKVFLGSTSGATVTTGTDGKFTFADVERPYTLVAVGPEHAYGREIRVFEGLTTATPTVSLYGGTDTWSSATITGVTHESTTPVDALIVTPGGEAMSDPTMGKYELDHWWPGAGSDSGKVHAIRTASWAFVDGQVKPASYTYGATPYTVTAGGSAVANVSLLPVSAETVSGTVAALPAGFATLTANYYTNFGGVDEWVRSLGADLTPGSFSYLVPSLPDAGATFMLMVSETATGYSEHAIRAAPGASGLAFALPAVPTLTAPADQATVADTATFQWTTPGSGTSLFYMYCSGGLSYEIVTDATSAALPDLSAMGVVPPPDCWWGVDWMSASVDWTLGEDYRDVDEMKYSWGEGRSVTFSAP